ncbi:VirB4 family type IV secretion system protein [Pseudonocardia sp. HH130629-09]|uniref:VirB4 family type IV secretion system protein n=1 Tax=Pseudonocardia sp. HH130629-09 TaxID=1641402 RepID=UPI0007618D58
MTGQLPRNRPPPRTGDGAGQVATDLARRLRPFVDGSHSTLFNGPTTHPAGGHLTVWSLKELPEALRPVGTTVVLDAVWRTVTHPHERRRRLVVVDEAWMLLTNPAGARFLLRAAKAARKHWCGLVVATQDTADVLASDLGRAVITNSATQILLRQAPQAIDQVATVFGLSAGERSFLLTAERGDGLLTGGDHRVAFAALASTEEDKLITTSPQFLACHPELRTDSGYVVVKPGSGGPRPTEHGGRRW